MPQESLPAVLIRSVGQGYFWFGLFVGFMIALFLTSRMSEADKIKWQSEKRALEDEIASLRATGRPPPPRA